MIESALWTSSLLAGLLAGPHCMAMCGGYVAALSQAPMTRTVMQQKPAMSVWPAPPGTEGMPDRSGTSAAMQHSAPVLPASQLWLGQLVVQWGRVASYTALGAILGALGEWTFVSMMSMQKGLGTLAALFLLWLAVRVAFGASSNAAFLESWGMRLFGAVLPRVRNMLHSGVAGRLTLGLLWGMTPCALVYGVLPLALLAGGAWQGGLVMLAFGLGTLPNLLLAGYVLQRLRRWTNLRWVRYAVALIIAVFAVLSVHRLWWSDDASSHAGHSHAPMMHVAPVQSRPTATDF